MRLKFYFQFFIGGEVEFFVECAVDSNGIVRTFGAGLFLNKQGKTLTLGGSSGYNKW